MPRRGRSIAAVPLAILVGLVACSGREAEPGPSQGTTTSLGSTTHGTGVELGGTTTSLGTTSDEMASVGTIDDTDDGTTTPAVDQGGPPPELCPPGVEPSLELGYGDAEFRPLDSGVAQLVRGHQGGHHVVLGLRGVGLDLADWGHGHLRATIAETLVADYDTPVVMTCDESGQLSEALWINLVFEADPGALVGQAAWVEVDFVDASEQLVSVAADLMISETIVEQ